MRLLLLLPLGAAAACQLVLPIREESDAGELDATTDAAEDAAGEDASDAADASDAFDGGPVNLVLNPSFELGAVDGGCGTFWVYSQKLASKQSSSIAHSGARSCEVCATADQQGVSQVVAVSFDAGTSFTFGGFIAPVPPDTTVQGRGFLILRVQLPDGGTGQPGSGVLATSTDGGWAPLFQQMTANNPGDQFQILLQFKTNADAGGCILIDDAFVMAE